MFVSCSSYEENYIYKNFCLKQGILYLCYFSNAEVWHCSCYCLKHCAFAAWSTPERNVHLHLIWNNVSVSYTEQCIWCITFSVVLYLLSALNNLCITLLTWTAYLRILVHNSPDILRKSNDTFGGREYNGWVGGLGYNLPVSGSLPWLTSPYPGTFSGPGKYSMAFSLWNSSALLSDLLWGEPGMRRLYICCLNDKKESF